MGFLKSFFGGKEQSPEEKQEKESAYQFDVLKTEGVRALHTGRWDYAVKCLNKALDIKDDLEVHDYLSQAYIQNEQFRKGYEQLQLLSAAQPDNINILTTMARVAYMMEDFQAMSDACEKSLLIDKNHADTMFLYARAALAQKDMVNAVAMYTKTLMLDENFAAAYLERGNTLLQMGDLEGAEEDADHLMQLAGNDEDVLLLKGHVLMARQRPSEAIEMFDKAIEGNPFSTIAYRERGAARLALGDKEGAEADLRQLLEIDPKALEDVNGAFKS